MYGELMAILKIARMGHPVLRMRAEEIPDPTAPDVLALAGHMIDTLIDIDGMGLAAPQVHVSQRLVIFRSPQSADEEGDGQETRVKSASTRLLEQTEDKPNPGRRRIRRQER